MESGLAISRLSDIEYRVLKAVLDTIRLHERSNIEIRWNQRIDPTPQVFSVTRREVSVVMPTQRS